MLRALAKGESDPAALVELADKALRATPEELTNAWAAAATLSPWHRQILGLFLDRLELIEGQMESLSQAIASALHKHNDAVVRLAEVPG